MLADWYLCASLRLPPGRSHVYLDILEALRESVNADRPGADTAGIAALVADGVEQLRRLETPLVLYALTDVLSAARALPDDHTVVSQVRDLYADLVEVTQENRDQLRALFDALPGSTADLLVRISDLGEAVETGEHVMGSGEPFHDLGAFVAQTVLMAVFHDLALHDPVATYSLWQNNEQPQFVRRALAGSYGRLALLLAARSIALVDGRQVALDAVAAALWERSAAVGHLAPDVLDALARVLFGAPGSDDPPAVDKLEEESVTGLELGRWRRSGGNADQAVARLGGSDADNLDELAAVLWQSTLWSLATETDPAETALRLHRWWSAPGPFTGSTVTLVVPCEELYETTWSFLNALLRLRGEKIDAAVPGANPQHGPAIEVDPETAAILGSPWTHRLSPARDLRENAESVFPRSTEPAQLIRVLAAGMLAVRLLRQVPPPPVPGPEHRHLLGVFFHAADVLSDATLRKVIAPLRSGLPPVENFPYPLSVLVWHVGMVLDRYGKANYAEADPRSIVAFLTEGDGSPGTAGNFAVQWQYLFKFAAANIVTRWIEEASSGGVDLGDPQLNGRWFGAGGPAWTVLRTVLQRGHQPRNGGPPITREARLFNELFPHEALDRSAWNWMSTPSGKKVDWQALLLAPEYELDVWAQESHHVLPRAAHRGAPLVLRTIRIEALLKHPAELDAGKYGDWIVDWLERLAAIHDRKELARSLRRRMIQLLHARVGGRTSQDQVRDVGAAVISAILDHSVNAQLLYQLLFQALDEQLPAGVDIANEWRLRTLGILYQLSGRDEHSHQPISPFLATMNRATHARVEPALHRFTHRFASAPLALQEATLGEAIDVLWRASLVRPDQAAVPTSLTGAGNTSWRAERLRVATFVSTYDDRIRRHNLDLNAAEARYARGLTRAVVDLFAREGKPLRSVINNPDRPVLAMACAIDDATRSVWFNCGLGRPVRHLVRPGGDVPQLGTPVAVRLVSTDGSTRVADLAISDLAPLTAAPPRPGETRRGVVHELEVFPWLRVVVDGRDVYPLGSAPEDIEARLRWDPDLGRAWTTTAKPAASWPVVCRWDEGLRHWLPVHRGLSQLLAGELGQATTTTLTFARMAGANGWEFVSRPGLTFSLAPADWMPDAAERLQAELVDEPAGLRMTVTVDPSTLKVDLVDEFAYDAHDWLNLLRDDEAVTAVALLDNGQWWLTVDAPPGYPSRVKVVTGLDNVKGRKCICSIHAWGEPQARQAEVAATPLEIRAVDRPEAPTVVRYHALRKAPPGSRVIVDRLAGRNLRQDRMLAFTSDNLPVFVPTDSMALHASDLDIQQFCQDRVFEVDSERVDDPAPQRVPVPVSTEALAVSAGTLNEPLRAKLESAVHLTGMIVQQTREDGAIVGYGIWLEVGEDVRYVIAPEGSLDMANRWVGDHVEATNVGGVWTFHARPRRVSLRGLYELRAHPPGQEWHRVGVQRRHDGDYDVFQQPGRAVLAVTRARSGWDSQARITRLDRKPWEYRGEYYVRVVVERSDGLVQVGDAREFPTNARAVLRFPTLDLRRRGGDGGVDLVDVRRTFVIDTIKPQRAATRRQQTPVDRGARFKEALTNGQGHLVGRLDKNRSTFWLSGYEGQRPDGGWGPSLPAETAERSLVDRTYSIDQVRARVLPREAGYVASFASAAPLTVKELLKHLNLNTHSEGARRQIGRKLFYVGDERLPTGIVHRFEFGLGWTVDIPAESLTVGGRPIEQSPLSIFHGDLVRAMRFNNEPNLPGGVSVEIDPGDIRPSVEGSVQREALADVVHQIQVCVDLVNGTVAVQRVHTRAYDDSLSLRDMQKTDWKPLSGRMDEASAALLLRKARARSGPGDTEVKMDDVVAKLDADRHRSRCGRSRVFTHVPLRPSAGPNSPGLRPGDVLYLDAQTISDARNDVYVEFRLHGSARRRDSNDEFIVRVRRRLFSYREGLLLRKLATGDADAYVGRKMLVRLGDLATESRHRNLWAGSTIGAPSRPRRDRDGYLRQQRGGCYATMGTGRVEIGPGIFFDISDVPNHSNIDPGALVRLFAVDEGVRLEVALPADSAYVRKPRPVVVFPKNPWLREGGLRRSRSASAFTVGGLPALEAGAPIGSVGRDLLHTPHPKLALAVEEQQRIRLDAHSSDAPAATLHADDPEMMPRLRHLSRGDSRIPWARVSFADGSAQEIMQRCIDGEWRYRDRNTGHWEPGATEAVTDHINHPATIATEPVFLAERRQRWTLRYPAGELERFGYPATELLDDAALYDKEITLVVAAPRGPRVARTGLWLERSPGRVIEVPASLFTVNDEPLLRLDWSCFTTGDRIRVRVTHDRSNDYVSLALLDWQSGARSAFGSAPAGSRLLLRVEHAHPEAGLLILGSGRETLMYPADRELIDRHRVLDTVWLDQSNDLVDAAPRDARGGDVVLLQVIDGRLALHGLPGCTVRLAASAKDAWPGVPWLRTALEDQATRQQFLLQLGGSLPVTVEDFRRADDQSVTVIVSRRHQPSGWWPVRRLVRTELAAALPDGSIVVRCGAALYRVSVTDLVDGATQHLADVMAALFRIKPLVLWWQTQTPGELARGIVPVPPVGDELEVEALQGVDLPGSGRNWGVICREIRSQALLWLPANLATWADEVGGAELVSVLNQWGPFKVVRREQGVSVVDRPLAARDLSLIEVGNTFPAVVCRSTDVSDDRGRYQHLVHTRFTGVLLTMLAPDRIADGAEVVVEVASVDIGRRIVIGVPSGTRRAELDLPEWLVRSLGLLTIDLDRPRMPTLTDLVPVKFARYAEVFGGGEYVDDDPQAAIVAAAGVAELDPGDAGLADALSGWLRAGGLQVVRGRGEYDLAPFLAACLVCVAAGQGDQRLARYAVFLTHQLGRRAQRSMHVETLVEKWLLQEGLHRRAGGWQRVRQLRFEVDLEVAALRSIRLFGSAVLAQPKVRGVEDDRSSVARALMAAAGGLESAELLQQDAPRLAALARWGRALSPPDDMDTAQPELLESQITMLWESAAIISTALPITLLPAAEQLPRSAFDFARMPIRPTDRDRRDYRPPSQRSAGRRKVPKA